MESDLARIKETILEKLSILEEELDKEHRDYEESMGRSYGHTKYVYRENLVVYHQELEAIRKARDFVDSLKAEDFSSFEELCRVVRDHMEDMYRKSACLRAGFRLIMHCIDQIEALKRDTLFSA